MASCLRIVKQTKNPSAGKPNRGVEHKENQRRRDTHPALLVLAFRRYLSPALSVSITALRDFWNDSERTLIRMFSGK